MVGEGYLGTRDVVRTADAGYCWRLARLVGSDLWELPLDERNAAIHDELKEMTLDEVRVESDRVFTELIEQLELLPEEAYGDTGCFEHMPAEWTPWEVMAGNTFRHYAEHTESIRRLAGI